MRNVSAAAVQNRAGAFVLPSQAAFPFTPEEMPQSITSRDWDKLDLNMSVRADKYPCGGLIYIIANADLSTLGAFPISISRVFCARQPHMGRRLCETPSCWRQQ